MQHKLRAIVLASLLLTTAKALADSSAVEFNDGWIKDLPPVIPMRAGYVRIVNDGDQPAIITGVTSPAFEKVEMHETLMQDGMMKMQEMNRIEIPADATVALEPGGKHLMLMQPKGTLAAGQTVDVVFDFADGGQTKVGLPIRK